MADSTPADRSWQPQQFQQKLAALISEARAVEVDADDSHARSFPKIRHLLQESLALLDDLEQLADDALNGKVAADRQWTRRTGTLILPAAFSDLADLCFIARTELKASAQQLAASAQDDDPYGLLVALERSQGRLSRGLCAVEDRLARISGHASKTSHVDLLRKALQARTVIAKFRQRVATAARESESHGEKRLRSVGTSIAWLRGHDYFSSLRVSDQVMARRLHLRVLAWLQGPDSAEVDSLHLWQEITAFAELLNLINKRPELVQHDVKVLRGVIESVASSDLDGPLPSAVAERLRSLLGRDPPLDEMIGIGSDLSRVLARVQHLVETLERGAASLQPSVGLLSRHDDKPGVVRPIKDITTVNGRAAAQEAGRRARLAR